MSFYKKIKQDAKRQKKEIMTQGEGYYCATVFEHYGAAAKRRFSWARVLANTAFLSVILISGVIWGVYGIMGDYSPPLCSDTLEEYTRQERYEEKSLIYNGADLSTEAAWEFRGDYKVSDSSLAECKDNMHLWRQEGVVLADISFFNEQSATVSYRVFVDEEGKQMYYLFTVDAQEGHLEIITFIEERYSSSQFKKEAERKVIDDKTVYLKCAEKSGETQYEVFYESGQKGVYLVLTSPSDAAYSLLENILSSLTE